MSWQLSLLITIALILLGLIYKRSKTVWIIQIIWIWILVAFNNGGADWNVHNHFFIYSGNEIGSFSSSWLYTWICYPFLKLGFSFFTMNFVVSTIALIFYMLLIKKNTKNISFVTSLFMIFPLADSIIQKRNFLACVIFLYGLLDVIKEPKKGLLKYTILTFIAAQIHSTFYIYLIFIPFFNMDTKKIKRFFPSILFVAFALIPFMPKIADLILGSTNLAFKVQLYFESYKIPFYQSCFWWVLQLTFTFLFLVLGRISVKLTDEEKRMKGMLDKLNILLLVFLPLYYYEATFFRLYRNTLLINYIFMGKYITNNTKWTKKKLYMNSITICFILFVFLSQFVFFGLGFDFLVVPLFEKNVILGW